MTLLKLDRVRIWFTQRPRGRQGYRWFATTFVAVPSIGLLILFAYHTMLLADLRTATLTDASMIGATLTGALLPDEEPEGTKVDKQTLCEGHMRDWLFRLLRAAESGR